MQKDHQDAWKKLFVLAFVAVLIGTITLQVSGKLRFLFGGEGSSTVMHGASLTLPSHAVKNSSVYTARTDGCAQINVIGASGNSVLAMPLTVPLVKKQADTYITALRKFVVSADVFIVEVSLVSPECLPIFAALGG